MIITENVTNGPKVFIHLMRSVQRWGEFKNELELLNSVPEFELKDFHQAGFEFEFKDF